MEQMDPYQEAFQRGHPEGGEEDQDEIIWCRYFSEVYFFRTKWKKIFDTFQKQLV